MTEQLEFAKSTFAANAKTFALAARFLPKARYDAVARLYAFCRQLDDLADASPAGVNHDTLVSIRQQICSGDSDNPVINDMLQLQQDFEIPTALLLDFVDTLIEDQYPRALADVDQLVRFAYGVASTVGLMMCHVFGVQDKRAYPFAVDLGVAMQITNIARDILEDAGRDRLYVPSTLLDTAVSCEGLAQGDEAHRGSAYQGALRMLAIADEYYASASQGFGYLPRGVRHSIKLAARLYQAIGDKILEHPEQYWRRRTVVSRAGKCHIFLNMLITRLRNGYCQSSRIDNCHRQHLHRALDQRRFSA